MKLLDNKIDTTALDGITNLSSFSLLQPQMASRFKILPLNVNEEVAHRITLDVTGVKMDFVKKILALKIRASILPESFLCVILMNESKIAPKIELLCSGDGTSFSLFFTGSKLIKHDFDLDYGNGHVAVHEMEWSFEKVRILRPEKMVDDKPENDTMPLE